MSGAGIIPGTTSQLDDWTPGAAGSAGLGLGTGTGRYGTQLLEGSGMGSNPFVQAWQWLNKPITTPLAPTDIFVIVGSIAVAILLWNLILYHVRIAAEAI